jgi:hypothetical protein
MAELRLRRDPGDRKRYVLDGVGEMRVGKWYERGATLLADSGESWEMKPATWTSSVTATDSSGAEAATYEPRGAFKRGGEIQLPARGERYDLKPSSSWRNRYGLWTGDAELAAVETTGWSGQEVAVGVSEGASVDPLLLLMACFLVRRFGEDEAAAGAAGVTGGAG